MKCPYCAEEIQPEAKKCKHCSEWLTAPSNRQGTSAGERGSTDARAVAKGIKQQKQEESMSSCGTGVVLIVALVIGFSIGGTAGFFIGFVAFLVGIALIASMYHKE